MKQWILPLIWSWGKLRFQLIFEVHNDPVEAAVRISRFWKYRKIFFGEQWLLPMTMNGFGALDELDCEAVKSGVVFIGPLITVDWTKAFEVTNTALSQGIDPIGSGERLLMYLMVANMEGLSRGPSILFHPILSKRRPAMEIHKRFWECFETACPSTLGEIVVTHAHQEEGQRELLDFLRYQTVSVVKMATSKVPKQIYSNSTYNTLALLQKNGVDRDIVPASIGGNLDNDTSFSRWTEMRLCIESFLALPPRTLQMPWLGLENQTKGTPTLSRRSFKANPRDDNQNKNSSTNGIGCLLGCITKDKSVKYCCSRTESVTSSSNGTSFCAKMNS